MLLQHSKFQIQTYSDFRSCNVPEDPAQVVTDYRYGQIYKAAQFK